MVAARPVLKRMECPNCGAPIEQFSPDTQTLVCGTCGSYIAIGGAEAEVSSKEAKRPPPPPKPIELGKRGTVQGMDVFVMGRVVYTGWDEHSPSDRWTWHEWLLGSADGRTLWLAYDEKGFSLYKKMRFRGQFDPRTTPVLPLGNDGRALIRERYPAKIVGAEGELTWRAQEGETLYVAEGAGHGKRYSIQKTAQEMEVHEGKGISEVEIATAFGDEKWIQKAEKEEKSKGGITTRTYVGLVFVIFAMLAFVAASIADTTGSQILQQTVTIPRTQEFVEVPVNITQTRRPHIVEINVTTAVINTSSFPITVNIIDPEASTRLLLNQTLTTNGFSRTSALPLNATASEKFVPYLEGTHQIRIVPSAASANAGYFDSATFTVTVQDSHITGDWFTNYGVIIGLIGAWLFITGLMKSAVQSTKSY